MRAQSLFLFATITLVGCEIHDYDYGDSYGSGPSVSAGTTGGYEDQVGSFPGSSTLGIVSDGTAVYVATQDSQTGAGSIVRLDGTTLGLSLAVGEDRPYAIASDELFVYYTLAGGGVHKVKKSGGSFPVSLTDARASSGSTPMDGGANDQDSGSSDQDGGTGVDGGATDDAGANATDGGSNGVDAGNTGSSQGNVQAAYGIALTSDSVYYTTNDGVHRVSKVGGDDVLFVPDAAGADAIVADDSAIFWMDHGGGSGSGAIKRADLATGAVTTLADGLSLDALGTFSLVADSSSLYFPEPGKGRVFRVSKNDGNTTTLTTGVATPTGLAVDDSSVYIASQGSQYSGGSAYSIQSVPKTGGASQVTFVATTINGNVSALVVDDSYVWFTTGPDGEVDRVSKYAGGYPTYGSAANGTATNGSGSTSP
jgi:hypothetical protein